MPDKKQQTPDVYAVQGGSSRREFIATLALACAGLLSAKAIAGTFASIREPGGPVRQGQILSESQMQLLRDLVEIIIPQTGTPGAAATDTHGFIDDQLANCQKPDEARRFITDLDTVGTLIEQHWNSTLSGLSAQDQHAVMTAIAHRAKPFDTFSDDFFYRLKPLTILGYYYSEAGASQELVYLPIPGGYDANFKVSDNDGRAFSPHVL
jgi:hypothetical protein